MKRLIIITEIIAFSFNILSGQLTGNGTSGNPYTGTISTNTTWYPNNYLERKIYVLDLTITNNATLTISPGIYYGGTVQFYAGYTLTIEGGSTFIINPNTGVTVESIVNNGTLILESNSNEAGSASLIHDSYDGTGVSQVKLYLSGGTTSEGAYKWHYISVPRNNVSVSTFGTLNLAQYLENLVTSPDNYPGWVAYDGYQYSSGNTLSYTFNTLALRRGYMYYASSGNIFTLTGNINYGLGSVAVTCGSGYPDYQGFNLIGNPFAACIDWNWIISNYPPAYVNNAIYFTNNGRIASYVGGLGDNGGTGTIPPMQGFFVKANANSSISLRPGARVHNIEQLRYKKGPEEYENSTDTISFIRLKIQDSRDSTDLVVRFNKKATAGIDKEFDAYEFSKTSGDINIWTSTGGIAFSINGLPFPESTMEIPVGVNSKISGIFRLSLSEINKLDDYSVLLKDNLTGKIIDLKKGEYCEFTSQTGLSENRFIVVVTKSTTGVQDITSSSEEKFAIYRSGEGVNIRYDGNSQVPFAGSVAIYDISGKIILKQTHLEWSGKGDYRRVNIGPVSPGIYIIKVSTKDFKSVEKIAF